VPAPVLGSHTGIPTRVPVGKVVSKIRGICCQHWVGDHQLVFPGINISVISKHIFFPRRLSKKFVGMSHFFLLKA
jgi:hypothetical protein